MLWGDLIAQLAFPHPHLDPRNPDGSGIELGLFTSGTYFTAGGYLRYNARSLMLMAEFYRRQRVRSIDIRIYIFPDQQLPVNIDEILVSSSRLRVVEPRWWADRRLPHQPYFKFQSSINPQISSATLSKNITSKPQVQAQGRTAPG